MGNVYNIWRMLYRIIKIIVQECQIVACPIQYKQRDPLVMKIFKI